MEIIEVLRKTELCHGLNDNELQQLSAIFHTKRVKRDDTIMREGEPTNELYIIAKGRVKVAIQSSASGGTEKIATIRDNEICGEFAFLDGSTRSASIVAEEESIVLFVDYLEFHRFMEANEHIGFIIMKNLAKILTAKIRKANFEIRNGAY